MNMKDLLIEKLDLDETEGQFGLMLREKKNHDNYVLLRFTDLEKIARHYDLFKTAKRMCVNNGISTEHYVELGSAKKIIPPLLCGMVEKTRGEEFYSHFLERVEKQQKGLSQKIAGYLGPAT